MLLFININNNIFLFPNLNKYFIHSFFIINILLLINNLLLFLINIKLIYFLYLILKLLFISYINK